MTPYAVAVVGAGFAGVAVVDALARAGVRDVVVVDERGAVGGRWLDRHDPGARSRGSLSESTLRHRDRTPAERSPSAPAMVGYLQRVGAWAGIGQKLVHDRVTRAAQQSDGSWTLTLASGSQLHARALVLATGHEGEPVVPEVRGTDAFEGPLLHTHVWQSDLDLAGRRVAVLAPGVDGRSPAAGHLSATEHVHTAAALAEQGADVLVFSPEQPWVLPERPDADPVDLWTSNRRVDAAGQRLRDVGRVVRTGLPPAARVPWALAEGALDPTPLPWQRAMQASTALARQHLDPEAVELHHASSPLSRGTVRSEAWFEQVAAGGITLHRTAVHRIAPDAVVDVQGTRHRVDALVLATGAHPVGPGAGIEGLDAADGGLLADWAPHLGTLGRVPNLFVTHGPASDLPVGGDAALHGARAALVARLVRTLVSSNARRVVATPRAVEAWERRVTDLQRRAGLVPDPQAVMWPGLRRDLLRLLRGRPEDFVLS